MGLNKTSLWSNVNVMQVQRQRGVDMGGKKSMQDTMFFRFDIHVALNRHLPNSLKCSNLSMD